MIEISGRKFGDVWLTSKPTMVGGEIAGKIKHTDNLIKILTPPLSEGDHDIEIYVEDVGLAVLQFVYR